MELCLSTNQARRLLADEGHDVALTRADGRGDLVSDDVVLRNGIVTKPDFAVRPEAGETLRHHGLRPEVDVFDEAGGATAVPGVDQGVKPGRSVEVHADERLASRQGT